MAENGNGNGKSTKIVVGVSVTVLLIWLFGISFSAGSLREKVQSLDNRTIGIPEMAKDMATIKNDIGWIKEKMK